MPILARRQTVGLAKELAAAVYTAPERWLPVANPAPEDIVTQLRDQSLRGNDTVLQGLYGGSGYSTFGYDLPHLYADSLGDHLRAIIGPDTLIPGVTTTLSATAAAGASTIVTAARVPAGSTVQIDTGANTEYAVTGTPSGSGPYTIPLTAVGGGTVLAHTHGSGAAVQAAALHRFAQDGRATPIPTFSLTQDNGIETRGYPGCVCSDLGVKIDPAGAVTASAKWTGHLSAPQAAAAAAFDPAPPILGWQWSLTVGGAASTRALSAGYAFGRSVAAIVVCDGSQTPREVWAGPLTCALTVKAVFDSDTDYAQFIGYSAVPVVSTLAQPLAQGGAALTITTTAQTYTRFAPDFAGRYLRADIEASGAFNDTDNGACAVTVQNFVQTPY